MKDTLNKVVIFVAGAAIGSLVTWKVVKAKYERIAQEEIDSVKEVFSNRKDRNDDIQNEEEEIDRDFETGFKTEKPDLKEYADMLGKLSYNMYATKEVNEKEKEAETMCNHPCIIPPDEFDEREDYETNTLYYYADKVLADDQDNIIEDVDNTVGSNFADHYGEYEDDTVFVRNDDLKAYYEILLDERNFSDVVAEDE